MFSELPGFFDRNFIVAFFLPSLLFVLISYGLTGEFGVEPNLVKIIGDDIYKEATLIGIIALLAAVFLMSLNFMIFRFFEGYGNYNPLKLFEFFHKRKLSRLKEKVYLLDEAFRKAESAQNDEEINSINEESIYIYSYIADRYPPKIERVLPTAFGNAVRAYEDYSEMMYGLDAIVSWVRLLAVIPKDFREMMNSARAELDMWMNYRMFGYILFIFYLILAFGTGQFRIIWFLPAILLFTYFSSRRMTVAATHYGDFIKSSYDLYIPALRDQLELSRTENNEAEIELWNRFTRQVTYHSAEDVLQRCVKSKTDRKKD